MVALFSAVQRGLDLERLRVRDRDMTSYFRAEPLRVGGCAVPFWLVFGLFWSGITLFFDAGIGLAIARQLRALGYRTTQGTIASSAVTTRDGDDGETYLPEVAYTYTVGLTTYRSTKYGYSLLSTSDQGYAYAIVAALPSGTKVDVFYNPEDPADAVLSTGLDGSDLFLPMFLTPFNAVMLGVWWGGALHLWRRGRRPIAGCVRIHDNGVTTRMKINRWPPLVGALAVLGLTAFVMTFVVAFGFGLHPSSYVMHAAWGTVCGLPVVYFLWASLRNASGRYDLVWEPLGGNLILPPTCGRTEPVVVPCAMIESIEVRCPVPNPRTGTVSGHAPTLTLRSDDKVSHMEPIGVWQDAEAAKDFAAWLREKLRVPE